MAAQHGGLHRLDALLPLDDFIRANGTPPGKFMERYSPVFADVCTLRGRIWALPTSATVYALHWNKALFRQAGLDPSDPHAPSPSWTPFPTD